MEPQRIGPSNCLPMSSAVFVIQRKGKAAQDERSFFIQKDPAETGPFPEGIMNVNELENENVKIGDKLLIFKENMSIL